MMAQPLTVMLGILPCVFSVTCLPAAEQAGSPACDPASVCTTVNPPAAAPAGAKQLWADSRAFTDAPPLDVRKWLSGKPEMEGKFLVIEFWRTWCGACKRMTPLMNTLHKKYGDELVVIGLTGEPEEKVLANKGPKKEYYLALDRPQADKGKPAARRTGMNDGVTGTLNAQRSTRNAQVMDEEKPANQGADAGVEGGPDQAEGTIPTTEGQGAYEAYFGVWGWPHVIILEPQHRTIIWEGFPGLKGYELTEAKVAKILAIGRSAGDKEAGKR